MTGTQLASTGSALSHLQSPTGSLNLLAHLAEHGESDGSSLARTLGSRGEFYSALERLKSLGFAFESPTDRGQVRVGLTVFGQKLGKSLRPLVLTLERSAKDLETRVKTLDHAGRGDTAEAVSLRLTLAEADFASHAWDRSLRRARLAATGALRLCDDALALRAHLQVARILQKRDDAGAGKAVDTVLDLASRSEDARAASEAFYLGGSFHERKGRYKEAEFLYCQAADRAGAAGDSVGAGRGQLGLGRLLGRRGDYKASCEVLAEAIRLFEKAGLEGEEELPRAYVAMGSSTFYRDEAEGVRWHEKGAAAAELACDVRMLAYALTNASAGYINRGELDRAEKDLGRAREIFTRLREARMLARVDFHRGNIEAARKHGRQAGTLFRKAASAYYRLDAPYEHADALLHHGRMEAARGETSKARTLLNQALKDFLALGNNERVARVRRDLEELMPRRTRSRSHLASPAPRRPRR